MGQGTAGQGAAGTRAGRVRVSQLSSLPPSPVATDARDVAAAREGGGEDRDEDWLDQLRPAPTARPPPLLSESRSHLSPAPTWVGASSAQPRAKSGRFFAAPSPASSTRPVSNEVCSCIHLKCAGILPGCTKPCRTRGENKETCPFPPKIITRNPKTQYKIPAAHLRWMQDQTSFPLNPILRSPSSAFGAPAALSCRSFILERRSKINSGCEHHVVLKQKQSISPKFTHLSLHLFWV